MLSFEVLTGKGGTFPLPEAKIKKIAQALQALPAIKRNACHATIAIIDTKDMKELNRTFRGKNKPTDILSFPQFSPKELRRIEAAKKPEKNILYLGDILLCKKIVATAAKARKKPLEHHVTHLVVHGLLHLLGYDHMKKSEAHRMERVETDILRGLGIPDPYTMAEPVKNRAARRAAR